MRDNEIVITWAGGIPPVHPALLARPEVRAALASHDIGVLFRVLRENGWTQRTIGAAVGMHQSEVSEILHGRRVQRYRVLARIADGLGIPRELMNLGPAEGGGAYAGGGTVTDRTAEVDAEMRRRALLAAATAAFAAQPGGRDGELAELPDPLPVPPPSRILQLHVAKVRELTRQLRGTSRASGSDPQVSSTAAAWATQLLDSPGAEPVQRALRRTVAELHIHAGYAAFDAGLADRTLHHYSRALWLATETRDAYLQATALNYAGLAIVEDGHPNEGLKLLQLGGAIAGSIPSDDHRGPGSRAVLRACALAYSATALARMGDPDGAQAELAKARELWQPTPTNAHGDLDGVAARLELDHGRLDAAELCAAASVRRWGSSHGERARILSGILLATIHLRAGESDGVGLAHGAITGAMTLSSVRARQHLHALAAALEGRPGSDARELARTARQVASTRA